MELSASEISQLTTINKKQMTYYITLDNEDGTKESVYKLKIVSDRLNYFKIFPDNYFNLMSQEPEISYFFKLAKKFQLDEEQLLKSYFIIKFARTKINLEEKTTHV